MQAIRWMHYNLAGDHFIAVYGSHIAQVVGIELSMFEAGLLQTEQLSILGSAWCEGRQELVTAGGDGTLLFACLRTKQHVGYHTGAASEANVGSYLSKCTHVIHAGQLTGRP